MNNEIFRTDYDLQQGDRYRQLPKGDSTPTDPKWIAFDEQLKAQKRQEKGKVTSDGASESPMPTAHVPAVTPQVETPVEFSQEDEAFIKVLNEYYGPSLPPHTKHDRMQTETSHWLCYFNDNDPQKAIAMARRLDWVKDWNPNPGEVEDLCQSAAKKKLLTRYPKALKELMEKAGIKDEPVAATPGTDPMSDLPFADWCDRIESLFDEFPCLREVCEPHPRRLWPLLLFASAAMMGTCMTLTYYYFYADSSERCRLNYIILGLGDPTSGKGAVTRLSALLLAPIIESGKLADDSTNMWKDKAKCTGDNKDKDSRPQIYNRIFGPRTSNGEFIRSMINCKEYVDGEDMNLHLVTVDSEKDNSINMSKSGGWQNRDMMTLYSFHNEWDDQHYTNKESVNARFRVFWNKIETATPMTLSKLVNERNVNTGLDTRMAAIPSGKPDFVMMPLRHKDPKTAEQNETLKQWAYRLDQRRGELPIWPLVEHVHKWCDERRAIAEFNDDQADWLLIKRVPYYGINVSAPYIDMRHWDEREQTGTYLIDDTDRALCDLVLDIQYRCQLHYFYDLHRLYYDNQLRDAAQQRRRTNRFVECYRQLSEEFSTEKFVEVFGYNNIDSAKKTLQRLLADKTIERTKRDIYRKLVSEL
ncbi:MAG: hypothetical protein K6F89_07930 [Prevotella sp.]|nr:hypothetical protein [Prevotella sp.]